VKTENPSACVTVKYNVCGNSGSAVLPVVSSCVNKASINPIQNLFYKSRATPLPFVTIYYKPEGRKLDSRWGDWIFHLT
jgi:hypothetical protein